MTRAIVYVPSKAFDPHAARCMQYLEDRGYQFEGLIRDDWDEAQRMLDDGEATVAIVSTEDHLDPKRRPRIEVVSNRPPTGVFRRRTVRIIRPGAGE